VGLKPTRGLVTNGTVIGEGLATSGVVTRTVADTAAALDVLARHDPAAWWSPPTPVRSFTAALMTEPPAGLRLGVLVESPIEGIAVDPACQAAVDITLRALETAGHKVVDTPLTVPPFNELVTTFRVIWNLGGVGIDLAEPDRVEPHNRIQRDGARATDSWTFAEAVQKAQRFSRQIVESFLTCFDLLVTPTMACLPPPVGFWRAGADRDPLKALVNVYPMGVFTSLFNVTGQPAISVPIHHDDATGLPVGIQIVAAPWREDLLLQVSRILELAHPWRDRRPQIS
jgi:amidase